MITISDKPHDEFIKDKDAMIQAAVDYWAKYLTKGDLGVDPEQSGNNGFAVWHVVILEQ